MPAGPALSNLTNRLAASTTVKNTTTTEKVTGHDSPADACRACMLSGSYSPGDCCYYYICALLLVEERRDVNQTQVVVAAAKNSSAVRGIWCSSTSSMMGNTPQHCVATAGDCA